VRADTQVDVLPFDVEVHQPLQPVPDILGPAISDDHLAEVPPRTVQHHRLGGPAARGTAGVDQGDLAVRRRPVQPHHRQRLGEPLT
jgi:hypothetical protein